MGQFNYSNIDLHIEAISYYYSTIHYLFDWAPRVPLRQLLGLWLGLAKVLMSFLVRLLVVLLLYLVEGVLSCLRFFQMLRNRQKDLG